MEKSIILLLWLQYVVKVRHFWAFFWIVNGQDAISLPVLENEGYVEEK